MNLQEIASASAMLKQELAPLADRIGQGAEYTFSLFVKQVYVNSIGNMLWTIPGIICLVLSKKSLDFEKTNTDYSTKGMGIFGFVLFLIIGLLMTLIPVSGLIQAMINPEFQAIKLIVETFKATTQ